MSDIRPGMCLCCNTPVTFDGKEWADLVAPAVLCDPCYELVKRGWISRREVKILYIVRSQIGWLFQEMAVVKSQMESVVESQAEMHKAFFQET